jgi:eukaryotic-like serine/threonine-protein kinase
VTRPVDASDSTAGHAVKLPATPVGGPAVNKPSASRTSVNKASVNKASTFGKSVASTTPAASTTSGASVTNDASHRWRVVTYTYNREDQARHKSETVAQKHPELNPAVFSPTGRAPYLVTVGGALSREEAFALVSKVRREGLPRDSYAQNYKE